MGRARRCGIFRPEVVEPLLGFDCPVLALGSGTGQGRSIKTGNKGHKRPLYKRSGLFESQQGSITPFLGVFLLFPTSFRLFHL